ncbi:putative diadenosine tetraphosphatase [Rubellimicrobium mesophilum DSM 19309]|uniref:Putative diadenosine tetraphosphatase n=1 Tax=Rubellimicrobium mesophilum DSM 19309 TaxID=442562 RepID=A0A017HHV0_9RHOB|nr:putative diadenosine tetraphosphatase [Rubellimicrobium mesophilum DSM 19309]
MTQIWDVIPDIHADIHRLDATLALLKERAERDEEAPAPIAFLGDFIDAGHATKVSDDAAVLTHVRQLVQDGQAIAVMGNHELNAILYHTPGPDGAPLRVHGAKNTGQHRSFLRQFGVSTPQAMVWVDWFLTLPLWRDLDGLRVVHACWSQPHIDIIAARRPDGRLQPEDLWEVATESTDFGRAVKIVVGAPELDLPAPYSFHDRNGDERRRVRIAWWRADAPTWRQASLSVPNPLELPEGDVPTGHAVAFYPEGSTPVLVGHYKMDGTPSIEAPQAACLDYPSTACAYRWRGEGRLAKTQLLLAERAESMPA